MSHNALNNVSDMAGRLFPAEWTKAALNGQADETSPAPATKKIRDDHGYWSQVEFFIAERSEAQFTHGLCPARTDKCFPGLTPEDLDADTAPKD